MQKYCLEKELKLKKIHQVIYDKQSKFMKSFISLNNGKRTECSINQNKIVVELFKRRNNANVGKQIENIRKYKDTRIANNVDEAKKTATKVTLNHWYIFSEKLTLYEMKSLTFYWINQ